MKTKRFLIFAAVLAAMSYLTMGFTAEEQPKSRIVEDGGMGAYKAIMKEEPTLPVHTVFVPQDLSKFDETNPLPILVWGNGACSNSPFEHYLFLNEIASHGFIVLATG